MAERDEIERKKNSFYFLGSLRLQKVHRSHDGPYPGPARGGDFYLHSKDDIPPRYDHKPYPAYDLGIPVHIHSYRGDEDSYHIYIELHRVSVDIMVELAIAAMLREIMLKGAVELDTAKVLGISLLIVVLGMILNFGDIRTGVEKDAVQ